jgi:pimeloyl-ACP methyl ester carboxylesterase
VPLAFDLTAPLANQLTNSRVWDFELGGFLSADDSGIENSMILMGPYRRGRIPLILVHGTASSPARWAELLDELAADPVVSARYQPWLFIYRTGAPILVSAASLRKAITETVRANDPRSEDPALARAVVVGHSQGGLLTRLMATSSGDRFWRNVSEEPFDSFELNDGERAALRDALFFEPVPQVGRVVFLATPHRGSYVAGNFLGRLGSSLISLPSSVMEQVSGAVTRNLARISGDHLGALPTAVDNMAPGSPFCLALADLPIDPRVRVNSIVAVDGDGPAESGDDGVVMYESAHLPDAESEIVVRSPHSCQGDPVTILEVRRILRLHAAEK